MVFTAKQKKAYAIKMSKIREQQSNSKPKGYSGYGGYKPASRGSKPAQTRGYGSYKTGSIGSSIGSKIGGFLGGHAENLITKLAAKLVGFGDYKLEENSIMTGGMSPPEIINSFNNQSTIVRHREYLGDVLASSEFQIEEFPLNPAQGKTFPWLSAVAQNYDEYKFRGVVFEFKSTSSDAVLSSSASSALGTVIMATNYNAAAKQPFIDKRSMENYMFASSNKPSNTFYHPVECKSSWTPSGGLLYTRTIPFNALPIGTDPRWYDMGVFNVATIGMQNAEQSTPVGELWCTYEVELRKQKLVEGENEKTDHWQLATSSNARILGVPTTANFGATLMPGSGIGTVMTVSQTSGKQCILFPPEVTSGRYKIDISLQSSGAATGTTVVKNVTSIRNGTLLDWYQSDTAKYASTNTAPFSANFNQFIQSFIVDVVQDQGTGFGQLEISFENDYVIPQGVSEKGDIWISEINTTIEG